MKPCVVCAECGYHFNFHMTGFAVAAGHDFMPTECPFPGHTTPDPLYDSLPRMR